MPFEKYIAALGLIGVLMVIFYTTGIIVNFKKMHREKLEIKSLKERMASNDPSNQ